MNLKLRYISVVVFLFQIISCIKPPLWCEGEGFPGRSIEIRFINQQGQNLIFGPNAQFHLDSIRLLNRINDSNSFNSSHQRGYVDSNNVIFYFYVPESKSYIYYDQQTSRDSLEIKWVVKAAKCKRGSSIEYDAIDSATFNNVLIKPVNGVYTFVK